MGIFEYPGLYSFHVEIRLTWGVSTSGMLSGSLEIQRKTSGFHTSSLKPLSSDCFLPYLKPCTCQVPTSHCSLPQPSEAPVLCLSTEFTPQGTWRVEPFVDVSAEGGTSVVSTFSVWSQVLQRTEWSLEPGCDSSQVACDLGHCWEKLVSPITAVLLLSVGLTSLYLIFLIWETGTGPVLLNTR